MTTLLSRALRLVLLMPLGACAYTNYLSGADAQGGTVNLVTMMTEDAALESAGAHCEKYHLVARQLRTDLSSATMTFTCEPPGGPQEYGRRPL